MIGLAESALHSSSGPGTVSPTLKCTVPSTTESSKPPSVLLPSGSFETTCCQLVRSAERTQASTVSDSPTPASSVGLLVIMTWSPLPATNWSCPATSPVVVDPCAATAIELELLLTPSAVAESTWAPEVSSRCWTRL